MGWYFGGKNELEVIGGPEIMPKEKTYIIKGKDL